MSDPSAPTISIVTCLYNSRPFIDRLYRSLEAQTYTQFEWVCVDDGSSDDTISSLRTREAPGSAGFKLYALPLNSGGSVALAAAVQRASGDAIMIVDHDDELLPHALQAVADEWHLIARDEELAGLWLQILNPRTGQAIGRRLPPGLRFSQSWLTNAYPDIHDSTLVWKAELAKHHLAPDRIEAISTLGIPLLELSRTKRFLSASAEPVRYYHKDNPDSQTNSVRVTRKVVYSYARFLDEADRHYLRNLPFWFRHTVSLARFSADVHGSALYALRYIQRPGMKLVAAALAPIGLLMRRLRPLPRLVNYAPYPLELLNDLQDLRAG